MKRVHKQRLVSCSVGFILPPVQWRFFHSLVYLRPRRACLVPPRRLVAIIPLLVLPLSAIVLSPCLRGGQKDLMLARVLGIAAAGGSGALDER